MVRSRADTPRDTPNRAIKDTSWVEPLPDSKNLIEILRIDFIAFLVGPKFPFAFS